MQTPFNYINPVTPPIFVGRENEIIKANSNIFDSNQNLAILGLDGVGKSSFAFTLLKKLSATDNNKILAIDINAMQFRDSFSSDFLSIITHMVCVEIWCTVIGKKYSELMELSLLPNSTLVTMAQPEEKTLLSIYNFITSEKLTSSRRVQTEAGGKFILEGKLTGSGEFGLTRKPIQPFEFLKLLSELNDIIKLYGYRKILIFCDQLNHYPREINVDLIKSYFDIFSSKEIQFIITAMPYNEDYIKDFLSCFNGKVTINPFDTMENLTELISNCYRQSTEDQIEFIKESLDSILEITEGYPLYVMKALDIYYKEAAARNLAVVDNSIIGLHAVTLSKQVSFYKSRMEALLG